MPRDSRERFSTAAAFYAEHRPQYPEALLDWLAVSTRVPSRGRIADVGCGTGIASRQLAGRGYDVVGIEPNAAMLAIARQAGGATFVRGEASSTGLPDHSVDLVIAAQAFHYFDLEPTVADVMLTPVTMPAEPPLPPPLSPPSPGSSSMPPVLPASSSSGPPRPDVPLAVSIVPGPSPPHAWSVNPEHARVKRAGEPDRRFPMDGSTRKGPFL